MGMIWRFLRGAFRLGLAVLALTSVAVLYFSYVNLRDHNAANGLAAPVDAILVLGGAVDGDGVLGYSSRRRVDWAVELLRAGQASRLILSGAGRKDGPPAAELMRDRALAAGVPAESLILEPHAVSTFENLRFGFALARQQGLTRLAILTDAFHLERARWLATYLGEPDAGLLGVRGLELDGPGDRVWSILREAMAWWYNLGKVGAWQGLAMLGLDAAARAEYVR